MTKAEAEIDELTEEADAALRVINILLSNWP
jgi:hypothetical protein